MSETTHPAGWYPTSEGQSQYWDGQQWTEHVRSDAAPAPVVAEPAGPASVATVPIADGPAQSPSPSTGGNGLAVAALIFAILIPPVGLVLGIVAAVKNRKRRGRAGGLTIASIIVGAVLTIVEIFVAIAVATLVAAQVTMLNQADKSMFCAIVDGNEAELIYFTGIDEINTPVEEAAARAQEFLPTALELQRYAWDEPSQDTADSLVKGLSTSDQDPMSWYLDARSGARGMIGSETSSGLCAE